MMAFADEVEKDEVVTVLELFVVFSDTIHSARAPAPAPLLREEDVSV
jgi:hypothetical protein